MTNGGREMTEKFGSMVGGRADLQRPAFTGVGTIHKLVLQAVGMTSYAPVPVHSSPPFHCLLSPCSPPTQLVRGPWVGWQANAPSF